METKKPQMLFINNPIKKLVSTYIKRYENNRDEHKQVQTCDWINLEVFAPIQIVGITNNKTSGILKSTSNMN